MIDSRLLRHLLALTVVPGFIWGVLEWNSP